MKKKSKKNNKERDIAILLGLNKNFAPLNNLAYHLKYSGKTTIHDLKLIRDEDMENIFRYL